jgi:LacI family transcriptional regulator, galactose operon repressor
MNNRTTVRMKDIAADLGISIVTVSRALRDRPDIAKETKTLILERARELNYRPNLMARSLVTGRTSLIGLIVPDLIHPFFAEVAKGLSAALRKKNYFVIISSSENDPQLECDEIDHMLAHHLDCFVVASCQTGTDSLKQIVSAGVPLILLDRTFKNCASNFVGVNDYRVGQIATEHLLAQGFKRIAHIRGPVTDTGNGRARGYWDTIRRNNLSIREDYVIIVNETCDSNGEILGKKAMDQILRLAPRPDAVFCYNDTVAVGAMETAFEAGLRIPVDIAFVGCGNFHYGDKLRVPLSSVDQRAHHLGECAAKLVTSILTRSASTRIRTVVLEPELIIRESSRNH